MKAPEEDQAVVTPGNGFYLCRPLKVCDLVTPIMLTMPDAMEKIKALSMSQVLRIWQAADPVAVEAHMAVETEIPEYTRGDVIIHREQGQNTFQAYVTSRPLVFVHYSMIVGQIKGLDVKSSKPPVDKPRLVDPFGPGDMYSR